MNELALDPLPLPAPIKILIAEDHQLLRVGLMLLLSGIPGLDVIGEAEDGKEAVEKVLNLRPDVAIIDIGLPSIDGIEVTYQIKAALPHIRVIVLTSHSEDEHISAALGASADAYCLKDIPVAQLGKAIGIVMNGGTWLDPRIADRVIRMSGASAEAQSASSNLTPANKKRFALSESEKELLVMVEQGLDNEEIAKRLSIATEEVSFLLRLVFERLFLADNVRGEAQQLRRQFAAELSDRASLETDGEGDEETFAALAIGSIFAEKYLIEALVGRGGIGRVYKARHLHMERTVAIKVLLPQFARDKTIVNQFKQEAKAASVLVHPNIVTVYDFGVTSQGQPYLVMDLFEGRSLADILSEQIHLELDQFFDIFLQVCDALAAAHAKNVVHCDFKPNNVVLASSENEEEEIVKVVDFGMAQILSSAGLESEPITSSELAGSPFFMSPEQCSGLSVDARTDLYSLGCVMYQALTGEVAFNGATAMECFAKHVKGTPAKFAEACPQRVYPLDLEDLVFRLMAPKPEDRFQSAADLKIALEDVHTKITNLLKDAVNQS
jgi:DNA-binding NarL/FixJ family response regulator/tRNA A-37 threonylcarbamoyl transferase component Bud32